VTSILILAATLLPRGWALGVLILLTAACVTVIGIMSQLLPPERDITATIYVTGQRMTQIDQWHYVTTPTPTEVELQWLWGVRPMLFAADQIKTQNVILRCDANGAPQQTTAALQPHQVLAAMSRTVRLLDGPVTAEPATSSPAQTLVRSAYLRSGVRMVGETAFRSDPERFWPAVVLEVDPPKP